MITNEQLQVYEDLARYRISREMDIDPHNVLYLVEIVRELQEKLTKAMDERSDFGTIGYFQGRSDARDVVRRLEREADWLARKHWPNCPEHAMKIECTDGIPAEDCRQCWREAARKAVQDD